MTTPKSGWLSKLASSSAFGTSRWQSRYFVLLDSEMRYYKDEHSVNASKTVNLRDIAKVTITSTPSHPHSFRLEPTLFAQTHQLTKNQKKTWTLECRSEAELEAWVNAINHRLARLICLDNEEEEQQEEQQQEQEEEQAGIVSPILQPFSTPEQQRQQPPTSLLSALTITPVEQPVVAVMPQPRLRKHNFSISRRRGVILSPLDIEVTPGLEDDTLSSSSSRGSSLPSPKVEPIIEEETDEDGQTETKGQANKVVAHHAYVLDTSSPTFALFRERYNT